MSQDQSLFFNSQIVGAAEDVTFDMAVTQKVLSLQRFLVLQDMAKDVVVRVFKKHGRSFPYFLFSC